MPAAVSTEKDAIPQEGEESYKKVHEKVEFLLTQM